MRRAIALGVVVISGLLWQGGTSASAQGPAALRMMAVGDNIATLFLFTGKGPHTLAFGAEDETITLIDTREPGTGRVLEEKVRNGVDGKVVRIILTNANGGASNGEFPAVTEIVAHENAKAAMAKMDAFKGANAKLLPNKTFKDTLSFKVKTLGEEDGTNRIDLHYFGRGVTDGDTVVIFPSVNTVFLGALYPGRSVPVIDVAKGGSASALADTLDKALAAVKAVPGLKIVMPSVQAPPAGPYVPRWLAIRDLEEYVGFTKALLGAVKTAQSQGKTAEQAAAGLSLGESYKNYDLSGARAFVDAVYAESKK
jgi:hypothetical protein